MVKIHQPG